MRRALTVAIATALSLTPVAFTATPASAATGSCTASMSVTAPAQYTTTVVRVSGVGGSAKVTTAAHYKTTTNQKQTTASTTGKASVAYSISRATKGYKVVVSVSATKGTSTWKCSTSFTPR
ncbi:hypothetical protein [Cellulomonas sp. URHD0024]|uniref:hypothetical protein n=1 Tax=Cellulomonas sp. URHD0024 TaxID=1302620 RepID=UPI0003FF691A|nr:hypothetical protein [Cellulomonas sp. URHD0024]